MIENIKNLVRPSRRDQVPEITADTLDSRFLAKSAIYLNPLIVSKQVGFKMGLKIGFIGCGTHATRSLYPSLRLVPQIELEAVVDLKQDLARRNADLFRAKRWYTNHLEMLEKEKDLNAVMICVNAEAHPKLVKDCLNNSLHVFVEKPAAKTPQQARELSKMSARTGRAVMVGYMKRFAPTYLKAKEITERADFGRITMVDGKWSTGAYPSAFTFLMEAAIHQINLVRMFGGEVRRLHTEKSEPVKGHAAFALSLLFKNGSVGSVSMCSTEGSGHTERVEIAGDQTYVVVENLRRIFYYPRDKPSQFWEPNYSRNALATDGGLTLSSYVGEIRHFAESILSGECPKPDIQDSVQDLEIIYEICRQTGTLKDWHLYKTEKPILKPDVALG